MDMGDHQHTAANGKQQRAVVSTARTKGGELLAGCATEEARRWSADLNELLVVELRSNSTTGSSVPAPDSSALKERHHLDRYNSDANADAAVTAPERTPGSDGFSALSPVKSRTRLVWSRMSGKIYQLIRP